MPHILLYCIRLTAISDMGLFLKLSASVIDIHQNVNLGVFDQVCFVYIHCQMSMVYLVIGRPVVQLQGTKPTENDLHNEH